MKTAATQSQTRAERVEARQDGLLAARPCRWGSPSGGTERPAEAVDRQQLYVPCRCTGAGSDTSAF